MAEDRVLGPHCNCGAIVGTHRHGVSSTTGFSQPASPVTDAREQIARALTEPTDWRGGPDTDYWLMRADRVLATPAVAEVLAAVERVRAEVAEWDDATRRWYYDNRHTHPQGIDYVCGFEDGWNHAEECIHRALDGDRG